MRLLKLSALLIAVSILLASCVEEVKLKPVEDRAITVSCVLKNNPVQDMQLYYIKPYMDDSSQEYEPITDASVQLYLHSETKNSAGVKDSVLVGSFVHKEGRTWKLDYFPEEGKPYSLIIESHGTTIYAKTTMPVNISVDKQSHPFYYGVPSMGFISSSLLMPNIFTPSYKLNVSQESKIWAYGLNDKEKMVSSIYTSHMYTDNFNLSQNDTAYVYGFVDNDKYETKELILNYHNYFVRFTHSPDYLNSYYYYVSSNSSDINGYLQFDWVIGKDNSIWGSCFILDGESDMSDLVIMNVSAEYDQYLYSCLSKLLEESVDDFTELFDQTNLYSNIHNGTGIFGAAYTLVTKPLGIRFN